jgi:secreted trypsin-like serine protease
LKHIDRERELILESVAEALRNGVDDRRLRHAVNEAFVKAGGAGPARVRVRGRAAAPVDAAPAVRSPSEDPRYGANFRRLAEHAHGGERIVGGRPVPKRRFLHCVAVGSGTQWRCTGTLIAPDVVITAGHCSEFATRIFIGDAVPKDEADLAAKGVIAAGTPTRHPGYNDQTKENDLTVIKLDAPVAAKPCRIAPTALIDAAAYGRVVGFGATEPDGIVGYGTKMWVDVPIASAGCNGQLDGETDAAAYACFLGRELVAGKPMLAKDSCNGDSGGPFYLDAGNDDWFVAGATSRMTNKAMHNCGDGGIYVRLDAYRDWIESVAQVTLE